MRPFLAGLLLLAAGALSTPALAQTDVDAPDPIDTTLSQCLQTLEADSTLGMMSCFDAARTAWEREMSGAFFALSASLDSRSRALLRGSQKQWEGFMSSEQRFQSAHRTRDQGSRLAITFAKQNADMVKNRVLALRSYRSE